MGREIEIEMFYNVSSWNASSSELCHYRNHGPILPFCVELAPRKRVPKLPALSAFQVNFIKIFSGNVESL